MLKNEIKTYLQTALYAMLTAGLVSCGTVDDDESDSTSTTSEETDGDDIESENPLVAAYPDNLALSVFPQSVSSSLALQDSTTVDTTEEDKKRPDEIVEERREILQGGEDSECFSDGIFDDRKGETITCYEFDNDMNPFNNGPAGSGGTATGKHTDGEACLVAFARQEVLNATQYVDRSLNTVAGMLCAVKKAGGDTDLPEDDAENDYTELLTTNVPDAGFTVAKIKNLGEGVYRTHIALEHGEQTFEMVLVYQEGSTEDENSGVISYTKSRPTGGAAKLQDENNSENMIDYVSVKFAQAYDDNERLRTTSEVRFASIEKTLDGLDTQGIVNYDVIPQSSQNDTSNNFKYVQFDIDAETSEGDISYWRNPGGRFEESARGFVFNISADETTGVLSGCGASGAASTSIRDTMSSEGEGTSSLIPVLYWHPFDGNNTHEDKDPRYTQDQGPSITVQCFSQDSTSGLYEIDYDATKALSDTTDETAIDTRGYDVVPQEAGNTQIKPPAAPPEIPEGEFKPEE